VIFLGYALGKAAAIQEGRHATLNQSFGPEARGSACSAEVILSDRPIDYPYIRRPSILISMSQDAFRRYVTSIEPSGLVLIDEDLVDAEPGDYEVMAVPATRIAEELGRRIIANMVMLGFIGATTRIVAKDAMREAVRTSVPSGTEELNLEAFDRGFAFGEELVAKKATKSST
jgi:2-oxoglutarate ferredoxin oxidoreductase subunit gamma